MLDFIRKHQALAANDLCSSRLLPKTTTDICEIEASGGMFRAFPDLSTEDSGRINLSLTTVIFGIVHNVFERGLNDEAVSASKSNLKGMYRVYLVTVEGNLSNAASR
ncbi:hypothetical protein [Pseudooceanicola atlanticus]|uniref:hypothetical protein n=1 Tax=Pseudooceanicola atlanticus TaxID=1461694 RepID=UPI0023561E34|nr:hypothetical protein [Pseudooceanicola atlanticus]